jgi:hypothetical protein
MGDIPAPRMTRLEMEMATKELLMKKRKKKEKLPRKEKHDVRRRYLKLLRMSANVSGATHREICCG